jgi:hypothetical protein
MAKALLNDRLSVSYPKGFRVMDEAERQKVFPAGNENLWAIWDKRHHVIISVQWHQANALLSKLVDAKSLTKRVQAQARKAYKDMGYEDGELYQTTVCGETAWGIDFAYQMQGVDQVAKALVFKHEACTYTLYCYGRKSNAATAARLFDDFLASLGLV